jgi:ATP-dependent exoDNAse (exonuclease V) alpha subunit
MTSVSLTGIQRQSNPEYREAIQTFRQSPDQGFAKLQEIGAVREVPYLERASAVADDKLLMLANRKDEGFRATNGELTTVRGVNRDGIHLDDGRSIPANYREFTHGYAVTAHRSQGKTVDSVIISADVMKQELFYVSASRGREDIAILTSDVNRLGESLGVSMARPSAIELANEIAHSKQQNVDLTPKASIEVPPPQLEISLGHGFELSM